MFAIIKIIKKITIYKEDKQIINLLKYYPGYQKTQEIGEQNGKISF